MARETGIPALELLIQQLHDRQFPDCATNVGRFLDHAQRASKLIVAVGPGDDRDAFITWMRVDELAVEDDALVHPTTQRLISLHWLLSSHFDETTRQLDLQFEGDEWIGLTIDA